MKYLFIVLMLNLFTVEQPVKNEMTQKKSTITIVDLKSNEKLSGVYNIYSKEYSDLDGNMILTNNDSVFLKFISYKEIKFKVTGDTTIKMNAINHED